MSPQPTPAPSTNGDEDNTAEDPDTDQNDEEDKEDGSSTENSEDSVKAKSKSIDEVDTKNDDTPAKDKKPVDDGGSTRAEDTCEEPKGTTTTSVNLGGEDVPGNGLIGGPDKGHALGSDFDDYYLTFNGEMLVNKGNAYNGELALKPGADVALSYKRGTTDCSHNFVFIFRRCPNKGATEVGRQELNIGRNNSGSITLKSPAKASFLDIVMKVSASTTRQYGGCGLPTPVENRLYNSLQPGFVIK
jgi:hypothetical protein